MFDLDAIIIIIIIIIDCFYIAQFLLNHNFIKLIAHLKVSLTSIILCYKITNCSADIVKTNEFSIVS